MKRAMLVLPLLAVLGCNQPDPDTAPSSETDPTPQVDTDPTPQTGTGGDTQTSSPDGTVNGAPGADPMENQGTPTD